MPPVGFEPTISAGERPAAAHLLRSWVRIPPGAWIFVCSDCRVLSGRGLCDELITRPEEFYRLCCVVVCDLETSRMGAPYIYMTLVAEGLIKDMVKSSAFLTIIVKHLDSTITDFYGIPEWYVPGLHNFIKNLGTNSKFWASKMKEFT